MEVQGTAEGDPFLGKNSPSFWTWGSKAFAPSSRRSTGLWESDRAIGCIDPRTSARRCGRSERSSLQFPTWISSISNQAGVSCSSVEEELEPYETFEENAASKAMYFFRQTGIPSWLTTRAWKWMPWMDAQECVPSGSPRERISKAKPEIRPTMLTS